MAIFGAGSNWNGNEQKEDFISKDYFVVGWNYEHAKDLIDQVSLLKAGDIIYLKANSAGSRSIRVKAIGVVKTSFVHTLIDKHLTNSTLLDWNGFFIEVKWIITEEFRIVVPDREGRLTNIRAATFYEEHLPYVQREILQKLYKYNFKNNINMDYGLGQFITGVISVGFQVLQLWRENKNIEEVQSKIKQFDEITNSENVKSEGIQLEELIPTPVLNTLKGRVDLCWSDFQHAVENINITPRQLDRYAEGLTECICRELSVIKRLNSNFPTQAMKNWWTEYKCAD